MLNFNKVLEENFKGYNVPKNIKNTSIVIMKRFVITGVCDGMYIANTIALLSGSGDGKNNFIKDEINNVDNIVKDLYNSYGCNIDNKEDLKEILNGTVTKDEIIIGIKNHINLLKEQIKTADYFKKDYLNSCIEAGKDILKIL